MKAFILYSFSFMKAVVTCKHFAAYGKYITITISWTKYITVCRKSLWSLYLVVIIFGGIDSNCLLKVGGLKFDGTQLFNAILNTHGKNI